MGSDAAPRRQPPQPQHSGARAVRARRRGGHPDSGRLDAGSAGHTRRAGQRPALPPHHIRPGRGRVLAGAGTPRRALSCPAPRGAVVVLRQPLGMRRYLDAVMETAGLYNTAGFNDNTRAFASIPSCHDVWRRTTCDWLAGIVVTGIIDEEDGGDMAREFAYGLAQRAYGLQVESVDKT